MTEQIIEVDSPGVALIATERHRQVNEEGFTAEMDDRWVYGELRQAAAVYALKPESRFYVQAWPWEREWFKPKDPMRDLVRAGALIAAEIDRLIREQDRMAE